MPSMVPRTTRGPQRPRSGGPSGAGTRGGGGSGSGAARGPAGYDAVAGLLVPALFPPAPDAYRYSARQRRRYLAALDALFVPHHLPPPSAYAADFRICKLLYCVPHRHHRPAQQQWLYARYRAELDAYAPPHPPARREP